MKYLILILAVISFSCSDSNETQFATSSELAPYVDSFYSEAALRGVNPPKMNLICEIGQIQAMTEISKDGDQWVLRFDKEMFEAMSANPNNKVEALIFHELGRIVLGRELNKDFSIMNGNIKMSGYSDAQRGALLDELFQ